MFVVAALTTSVATTALSASPAGAAAVATTNKLVLSVTSATTSLAGGTGAPHAGDQLKSYKWLIQKDNTGDPNQPSGPVGANDGTLTCPSGACTLFSPSAPFLYLGPTTPSPDLNVPVTGTGLAAGAHIVSVTDAQHVMLSAGAFSGTLPSPGTFLFVIQRPDPCRPVTPVSPTGNANFPAGCNWPSIQLMSHSPIVTQGDQSDWSTTQQLSGKAPNTTTPILATTEAAWNSCTTAKPCKFFVSVTADGFEISGTSFTVPTPVDNTANGTATIKVGLNAGPLTLGTMKILAFDDMAPTGGAYEAATETGLAGFTATLTNGPMGAPVSQDYFGNPLCTVYKTDANGNTIVDATGAPTIVHLGGQCVSRHDPLSPNNPEQDGIITIPNLAPGRYGANVVPPDKGWIQTTTLEGGHDFDVWLSGGDTGNDTELVAGGEAVPFVQFGFARAAMTDNNPTNPQAYVTCGGQVPTPASADGSPPTGNVAQLFTTLVKPCPGTNMTPRIDPGIDGQKPTPDGTLQADSWQYPYDPAVYGAKPPTGGIKGNIVGIEPYVPGIGGLNGLSGSNGQAGIRLDNTPIHDGWVALADLNNGDQTTIVAPTKSDGTFNITNVPDGSYQMGWWDWNQDYAQDAQTVTVANGQVVTESALPLSGWFTRIQGHVFIDKNGNGIQDPGESGVPDFLMQILNRTNNAEEGGQNVATTNDAGFYQFKEAYPLGNDLVLQFFNTKYKTTGVTCRGDNDPQQHTVITGAVDLTTLNIIGLNGTCDIGVQPYNTDPTANDNGGIVATAMYHSFRTETAQEQAFTNSFDTGQPGIRFELWKPVPDSSGNGTYLTNPDGSLQRAPVPFPVTDASGKQNTSELAVYDSEHYGRPGSNQFSQPGCTPRGADGQPLDYSIQDSIPIGGDCIEAPLQGTSFGFASDGNPVDHTLYDPTANVTFDPGANTGNYVNGTDPYPGLNGYCAALNGNGPTAIGSVAGAQCGAHGIQVVDGNYTMTPPPGVDARGNFTATQPGDYIVRAVVPNDMFGKPMYKWASEATNNSYEGPGWMPQNASGPVTWPVTPGAPAAAGPKEPGFSLTPSTSSPSVAAKCAGAQVVINNTNPSGPNYVSNPSWVDFWTKAKNDGQTHGGPFEGQPRPVCDSKLIHVQNGQSVAPNFHIYTDVPLATPFQGYAVDDISVSTDRRSTSIGEVAGIPNLPIGVYDWTGRLIQEVNTDYNGQYSALMPSTNTFNCNTPSGPCPSVYRFVGNDPGQPYAPNLNYNPTYHTISATFQAWPNVYSPSDVAPTRAVVSFEGNGEQGTPLPAQQLSVSAICAPRASQPQIFAVSHPFFSSSRSDTATLTISGIGFGATDPSKKPLLGPAPPPDAGVTLRNADTGARVGGALQIKSWSDTQIVVQLNGSGLSGLISNLLNLLLGGHPDIAPGAYQLQVQNGSGMRTTNAVTFHVLGNGYSPKLYEVGTFNSGLLNQSTGQPVGAPITDNGYVSPGSSGVGPVQDTIDSTTGGFNPNNSNFLPPGDPSAQDTRPGGVGPTSHAFVGDAHVKGAVQRSLEAAFHNWKANNASNAQNLIVVYPNFQKDPTTGRYGGVAWDPTSAYFENIVIHSPVALQGTGPGGMYKDANANTIVVPGATIDGRFFNAATSNPATTVDTLPGSEPWAFDWDQLLGQGAGNPDGLVAFQPFANSILEGEAEVVLVLGNVGWYAKAANGYRPSIDGLGITGGDQKGFPLNISETSGKGNGKPPDETFDQAVQGGGIMLMAYAQHFQISNDQIANNSGTYGGAIRSGSPEVDPADADPNAHNDDLHIHHNRITGNGGTNLAGGVGLFRGTSGYRIDNNVICGNLSSEYGGGISHWGFSPGGQIDHNQIMLNQAIDEGGGMMVAGEPALNLITSTPDPNLMTMGAGPVSIHDNYIGDNMAYDDGGGVRFLEAGVARFDIVNNMITDNVSAHEGGGLAVDNTPDVHIVNTTVADNVTTATATTSDGTPAPAGLSVAANSTQLQQFLLGKSTIAQDQPGAPLNSVPPQKHCADISSAAACTAAAQVNGPGNPTSFSKPLMFNDIFWNNLAGTWDSLHSTVTGICLAQNGAGQASPCQATTTGQGMVASAAAPGWDSAPNHWDIGVADHANTIGQLAPTRSLINSTQGWPGGGTGNVFTVDPKFKQEYLPAIQSDPYRLQPRFRPSTLITISLPPNVLGDYHIQSGSGAASIGIGWVRDPDMLGTGPCFTGDLATDHVCAPLTDIDGQARPAPSSFMNSAPDAGADQGTGFNFMVAISGRGRGSGIVLISARLPADGAPPPPAPEPSVGQDPPSPGIPGAGVVVPTSPPAGSLITTSAVGAPDAAGNTAVVQAYGKPGLVAKGVPAAPRQLPSTVQPANMPGGVRGLGHFKVPGMHHVYQPARKPLGSRIVGALGSPPALLLVLAVVVGLLAWLNRRRRRHDPPGPDVPASGSGDPPPGEPHEARRELVLAGKGDGR